MASEAGTPARPKKKRVDLAALYQAVQESSAPAAFMKPTEEAQQQPKDAFNPQAFLSNILRTQSLKELLETDSSMLKGTKETHWNTFQQQKLEPALRFSFFALNQDNFEYYPFLKHTNSFLYHSLSMWNHTEIKDLENNMKALVYANYSKFITASTTIHQLRGKVEGMEDEMQKLAASVEKITGVSDKISGTLQSKREIIEHLSGVHHLLQKLQFLVDLPARLRSSIQAKNYEEAVTYWRKTHHVLEKYKHFSSFTPIETQCSEIIQDLTAMLSKEYFAPNASYETISSYAALLLDLEESPSKIRTRFLQGRLEQLSAKIQEFESTPMVSPSTEQNEKAPSKAENEIVFSPEAEAAFESVSVLNRKITQPIDEFINTYCNLFVSRRQIKEDEQLDAILLLDAAMSSLLKEYTKIINKYLFKVTLEEKKEVQSSENDGPSPSSEVLRAASDALDHLLGTYWSTVLLPSTAPASLLAVKQRTKLGDTSEYLNKFITHLLEASFADIEKDIIAVISTGLEKVTANISAYVESGSETATSSTKEAIDNITTGIVASLDASFAAKLHLLFSICSPGSFLASSAPTLLTSVQEKIQSLLHSIVEQFGGTDATRTTKSSYRLIVAPLVFDALKNKALPLLGSTLGRIISQTKHTELGTDAAQNRIHEFGTELSLASQRLITKHVRDTGVRLGEMLRTAIETPNWLKRPEPHGVDGAIEIVVRELKSLQTPLGVLYELGPRKDRQRVLLGSVVGADHKLTVTSDLEFEQLFQKKVSYFDKVEFNSRAISTATIKIALKTYLESVRLQTYSTNGYQQLQLDVHYLNLVLDQYVSDPAALDAMMMDILNSVKERCIQPFSMDLPIIAKLCSEAYAKLNPVDLNAQSAAPASTATSGPPATSTTSL